MKVLIVEDEGMAAKRLNSLLDKSEFEIEVLDQLDSIKTSVKWLSKNQADLIFLDIQLADGLSFEIFKQIEVKTPIIFTTAYDEYAIQAFKVNSVDYLLKPIDPEELSSALQKFEELKKGDQPSQSIGLIEQAMQMLTKSYKERFLVKIGEKIHTIPVAETAYFFSQDKATFLVTETGKRYVIDYALEEVDNLVDPNQFFRISRKYLISLRAVKDIITYSNSRLRIVLHQSNDMDCIVSRERVQDFKRWLDR